MQGVGERRVLVVDDEVDVADGLADYIACLGHRTWVALDSDSALRLAFEHAVDTIFLDLSLPGRGGIETARELRRRGFTGQIIIISGTRSAEVLHAMKDAGLFMHLMKPPPLDTIAQLLSA
jgi:two-component system, chemotaxis family, CheB/CheR fusion protein